MQKTCHLYPYQQHMGGVYMLFGFEGSYEGGENNILLCTSTYPSLQQVRDRPLARSCVSIPQDISCEIELPRLSID